MFINMYSKLQKYQFQFDIFNINSIKFYHRHPNETIVQSSNRHSGLLCAFGHGT